MPRDDVKLKIMLVGGGTGGHITPTLAVAGQLKAKDPDIRNIYVLERGSRFVALVNESQPIDSLKQIRAGKFRRYQGESWLTRLLDIRTWLLNIRDFFYMLIGIVQAFGLLGKVRPDVIFIKGGFVGVPVGIAARLRKIPFLTHDSDTVPGLANRIIGRWASLHATGMPAEFYDYPSEKVRYVGIPLGADFKPVTKELKQKYKEQLGLPSESKVILVTGGSQGAAKLNKLVRSASAKLLDDSDNVMIHQTGRHGSGLYKGAGVNKRLIDVEFLPELYKYSGAADVIVTRAGATSIAEFALQGKACILVPHPHLTNGHQLKNAAELAKADAAIVLAETEVAHRPEKLVKAVNSVLVDKKLKSRLEKNISKLGKPDASDEIAKLILGLKNDTSV